MEQKPTVSIIVPVKNGEKTLKKCIDSILNLNYPNYELIIVNDGSTDNTQKILEEYKDKIKIINTQGVGPSKARNLAVKQAKGELVAFTDSDCIVDKEWLNELVKCFKIEENLAGVGGEQLSPQDESNFGKIVNNFMHSIGIIEYVKDEKEVVFTQHNPTCNSIYKKEVFEKLGVFKEGLWPGEDVEFDYRVTKTGYKLLFNPKAIVYHYRPQNIKKFIKMMYKYGKVQGILVKMYGFFRKIHFVPFVIFSNLILLILLAKFNYKLSFFLLFFYIFLILFYLALKSKSVIEWLKFIMLFFITIFFWNIGFVVGYIKNER
jgi:cellulose synthase/poly-beta-1,6-N-acetylglucosamine synthase-like glycosyltransferase